MSVRPSTLAGPVVFVALALAPLVLDDWRLGELSQFLAYGILAMSLALIWGQAGCSALARRCSSASAPTP